jgi:hypothetical protein
MKQQKYHDGISTCFATCRSIFGADIDLFPVALRPVTFFSTLLDDLPMFCNRGTPAEYAW